MLEGTLMFEIGSDVVEAKAGSAVLAPAGASHTYWNPSAEPARYVIVMTPRIHQFDQGDSRDASALAGGAWRGI